MDDKKTGRDVIARNIGWSYAGHLVFIVFGFLMPRIINDQIGQVALGVWDFSWSFVGYLNMSMIGLGSSVNRYVAKYLSSNNLLSLNKTVSTVIVLQLAISITVLIITVTLSYLIPLWFAEKLGSYSETAGDVIIFLGGSVVIQMAFNAWRGVITGCHRWDYHNALNAIGYLLTATSMIGVLLSGGGLVGIAMVYCGSTLLIELVRWRLAHRVCPQLVVNLRLANVVDARKVFRFGVKTSLLALSQLAATQTINIVIVATLGPAALAIISRPFALMRQLSTLADKFSNILTPMVGSMQSLQQGDEIQKFTLQTARIGWLIAVPPAAYMMVMGDFVLELWMGVQYSIWWISAVLAAGFLLSAAQSPVFRVLAGLDRHGSVAKFGVVGVTLVSVIGVIALWSIGWSINRAALLLALVVGFVPGITIFIIGFRYLNISAGEYYKTVLKDGATMFVLIITSLTVIRVTDIERPAMAALAGLTMTLLIVWFVNRSGIRWLLSRLSNKAQATNDGVIANDD